MSANTHILEFGQRTYIMGVLNITPDSFSGDGLLAGTDLHFSMGGVEINQWKTEDNSIAGSIDTEWEYPVKITAVFPKPNGGYEMQGITVHPGQKDFWIANR